MQDSSSAVKPSFILNVNSLYPFQNQISNADAWMDNVL